MKEDSPFYLAISHRRSGEDTVWYTNGPLSKNAISQFLKESCQKAGVPGHKNNHSARKIRVKTALDAGCPREYVAQLTGHKSVNSLENYAQADDVVQQAMCSSVMHGIPYCVTVNIAGTSASVNATVSATAAA